MSYPAYDPRDDTVAALADRLVGSTALVSILVNHLSGGEFDDLPPDEQHTVHAGIHMTICDLLTELGARHPAADIATAVTVLDDALSTIAENVFADDGQTPACEGRAHLARRGPRRR